MIAQCDQCGYNFTIEDETPVSCPQCDRVINFFVEDDNFRVDREILDNPKRHEKRREALSAAAAKMGRVKSERKAASSRENGKKGGRPARIYLSKEDEEMYRNLLSAAEKYDGSYLTADGRIIELPRRGRGYIVAPKAVKP